MKKDSKLIAFLYYLKFIGVGLIVILLIIFGFFPKAIFDWFLKLFGIKKNKESKMIIGQFTKQKTITNKLELTKKFLNEIKKKYLTKANKKWNQN